MYSLFKEAIGRIAIVPKTIKFALMVQFTVRICPLGAKTAVCGRRFRSVLCGENSQPASRGELRSPATPRQISMFAGYN
jgi:hypothetical protein